MSDVVPHKQALNRKGRLRNFTSNAESIIFISNQPPKIRFSDSNEGSATCLGCHDAPCIEFAENELNLEGALSAFPGDPSHDVCPVNAINWDTNGEIPTIDTESCIGCGLCAVRCPYGAISLTSDGVVQIEGGDPDGITSEETDAEAPHLALPREGKLAPSTYPFASQMPEIVGTLSDIQTTRLVRNMLTVSGVSASMRRKGDTNIRMDGVLQFQSAQIGVVELETSAAVLESPRALLEDIAVLHSRFNVPMEDIVPVSIISALPNVRAEYYQVIDDIEKVLNIRCRTLTLGILGMLVWQFKKLEGLEDNLFSTKAGSTDLYQSLAQLITDLSKEEPYPGAYRPSK